MEKREDKRNRGRLQALLCKCLVAIVFCGFVWGSAIAVPANDATPLIPLPDGILAADPPETYNAETLYEKINGQAELYLSAGFVELKSQWYESKDDTSKWIEVNIYHMGSLVNAFSVYGQQRRSDAKQLNITQFAYATPGAIFFVHGPYYVEILSSDFSAAMTTLMTQLAERFIKETPVEAMHIKELQLFPPENMEMGSIAMVPKDAFGMEGLAKVFTAAYTFNGSPLTVYISDRGEPKAAQSLVDEIRRHFKEFGGTDIQPDVDIQGAWMLDVMGSYELVFSIGPYLVGVHEAKSKLEAERMGHTLRRYIMENYE